MTTHRLDKASENLHGWFSRDLTPRLRIASGDTVIYQTANAGWDDIPPGHTRETAMELKPPDTGHALSGPVFVAGAEPGDTLEIRIREIVPTTWGFNANRPGRTGAVAGLLGGEPDDVTERFFRHLTIDAAQRTADFAPGISVPLDPFMGIYATCPADAGVTATAFPGPYGGNMDCKELRAGTALYLPVFVPGALFSVGDGHAAQGDGEVNGTAIECGMDRLVLEFVVRKDFAIARPCAETDTHLLFLAFGADLDEACVNALRDTMHYLTAQYDLTREEAYSIASIAVDFRITQVVDGPRGVHAMLPKAMFTKKVSTFSVK